MTSDFSLTWNTWGLKTGEAQKIFGGVAPSPCGGMLGAFSCTTTFDLDGDSWTSTGLVCAESWRHATERVYVHDTNIFIGTGYEPKVSVKCNGAN
jgi:hypothetical protein